MIPLVNYENNDTCVHFYENITQLANQQVSDVNMSYWQDLVTQDYSTYRSTSWLGVPGGIPEVRKYVELDGWEAGVAKGMEALGNLPVPKLPTFRRKKVRAASGNALDIHRVYGGDLSTAWESTKREQSLTKMAFKGHVNIIVDLCANANVGAEAMFWRGAVGCLLAKSLIQSGRHVRIIAAATVENPCGYRNRDRGYGRVTVATVIKDWNYPLELNSLFASTALAGFFRHYYFKSIMAMPKIVERGIGQAMEFKMEHLNYHIDSTTCIIVESIWNKEQALSRAEAFVKQIENGIKNED